MSVIRDKKWKEWGMYIATLLFLLLINDWEGLLDGSEFLPKGEFYDFVFAAMLLSWGIWAVKNRTQLKLSITEWKILFPMAVILIYCSISGIACIVSKTQGFMSTVLVLREVYYVLIFLPFLFFDYDIKKMLRVLLTVDILGSLIKTLEIFTGPLTSVHVGGIYESTTVWMWRCFSEVPLLSFFLCPLLIYGLLQKQYILCKWGDIVACLIIFVGRFFDMSRMAMFALIVVCSIAYVFGRGNGWKTIGTQLGKMFLIFCGLVVILIITFPSIVRRFINGFLELFHLYGADYTSEFNLAYRTGTLLDRWEYLKHHNKLLFGFGPLHNDLDIWVGDRGGIANAGVVAPDTAYGALLLRFGCIGVILIVLMLLWIAVMLLMQKCTVTKSAGLLIIGNLINGICEHPCLGFAAFLVMGVVLGIALKARNEYAIEKAVAVAGNK